MKIQLFAIEINFYLPLSGVVEVFWIYTANRVSGSNYSVSVFSIFSTIRGVGFLAQKTEFFGFFGFHFYHFQGKIVLYFTLKFVKLRYFELLASRLFLIKSIGFQLPTYLRVLEKYTDPRIHGLYTRTF